MLGVNNRFAALKVEDDEEESSVSKGAESNQNQSNSAAKKKNKKKKKESDEALRNMAFGAKRPSSRQQKVPGSAGQQRHGNKPVKEDDWEEWQRRDTEVTEDMYERQLQQAILDSKMEAEQQNEERKRREAEMKAAGLPTDGSKEGKKKKKKDKPQAMSLDQFNQLPPERIPGSEDEEEEPSLPPVHHRVPAASQDPHYFDNIASDASKILQKERIQEQYQKAYALENAMKSKYKEQLEMKDQEIAELKAQLEKQGVELKEVKKRSTMLCKLLAQGEMKDKAAVLEQVETLSTVRDELTEQVATLTADLEKERSKVHALKLELDKVKGKHGKSGQ